VTKTVYNELVMVASFGLDLAAVGLMEAPTLVWSAREVAEQRGDGVAIYRASSTYSCGRWSLTRTRIGFIDKHRFLLGFILIPIRVIFLQFHVGENL
jgi:hypothetical protein